MLIRRPERVNRFWHSFVTDTRSSRLVAVTHYTDPWHELRARLEVRPADYLVLDAEVEVMRAPGGRDRWVRVPLEGVRGASAYAGIGRTIREATGADPTGQWAGALVECAKVLRQARLFVWDRLGIDPAGQLPLIRRLLVGSCVFYALPDAVNAVLNPRQLREMTRWDCLFSRHRYCFVEPGEGRSGVAAGITVGLSDSYHEMQLRLIVRDGRVAAAAGGVIRAPHRECFTADPAVGRMRGADLAAGPREWEKRLGGRRGCTHLADLAREACASTLYVLRAREGAGERAVEVSP